MKNETNNINQLLQGEKSVMSIRNKKGNQNGL